MSALALTAALLLAASPAAPAAATAPGAPPGGLADALGRLLDEDVAAAAPVIEAHVQREPGDLNGQVALGILRFFQHRYDEAVTVLETATPGQDPSGYLRMAKNARTIAGRAATAESDHFVVAYPKGKDEVLAPYLLETLEAQRTALEKDLGLAPPGKVRVEVLDSPADLARLSTLTDAEIRGSGTIALCKYGKLMLVSPKATVQGYDWLDTAAHEFTHFVVTMKTGNRAPIWLQEGIARWSETRWRTAGGDSFSPVAAAAIRRALETNTLVTFEQMHPSMAKLPTQEQAALAYAEVVLMVELMIQRGGPGAVNRVLDLVAGGTAADQATAQALGLPWPEVLAAWKRHMAARPLPRGGAQALQKLRFKDDPKQAGPWAEWADLPDQASRDHARLGQLFRERGRWAAARVEYRKAVDRAGTRVPILANQYAIAASMSGKKAEAEKVLHDAIGWSPEYAALRVQLARLLIERKEFGPARAHLVEANRQDPFDPEIHAGLALCAEALGDQGAASRERRFAEMLSARAVSPAAGPPAAGPPARGGDAPPHVHRGQAAPPAPHDQGHP